MKIKIELTEEQLEAIEALIDDVESMIGGANNDEHWQNSIDNFDEVLKQNKLTPRYLKIKNYRDKK